MHGTSSGAPIVLSSFGGLTTLAPSETLPDGASPRCYDVDFLAQSVFTRSGLVSVYPPGAQSSTGARLGGAAASSTWLNPTNILLADGNYTSRTPLTGVNPLNVTQFGFNLPTSDFITGIQVQLTGFCPVECTIVATLFSGVFPIGEVRSIVLPASNGTVTLGSLTDTWGVALTQSLINSSSFGIQLQASSVFTGQTAFLDAATVNIGIIAGSANYQFITTFTAQNGDIKNLSLDAIGNFWVEDVTNNPGVLTLAVSGIANNSFAVGVNGPDVEYLAFNDGFGGSDMGLQYTSRWIDKITQVGPGAPPIFTPVSLSSINYPIVNITQPAAHSQGFSYFLQSGGPGSTSPGNVITFYYQDSTLGSQDQDLVDSLNSGFPVYAYVSFTGTPAPFGPLTVQILSAGLAAPPGQPRSFYYFTFNVSGSAFTYFKGSGHAGYTANWQRSLATLTTSVPVPNVTIGTRISVTGNSVASYNAGVGWLVSETPNSSSMVIGGSQVTSGVATFNYSVVGGTTPPQVGQLVTITNTLNANGQLNISEASITASSGGSSGTFSIEVSLPDFAFAVESGLASTAGTVFDFDPGLTTINSATSPIYGTGTGGNLVFNPTQIFIDPGTYQGTVFFITRNGYYTSPAPPVTFTVPNLTTNIAVTNLPIGPPNVVMRGIALTEAGQLNVPGANFFTLPTPVDFYQLNKKYTSTSFFVPDNLSSSYTLFFTGAILDRAQAIDVYGYNLFNQIEIGDPGWICSYSSRNFYGLCRNKVQNFNNLSFDGGYLSAVNPLPLGWTVPLGGGQPVQTLVTSSKFGNAYYIKQLTGAPQPTAGLISQTAYQDAYKTAIINANTFYSVRVTARIPSGITTLSNLVVSLTDGGATVGSFILPFSSMTPAYATFTGTLLTSPFVTVPTGLTLNVFASLLNPAGGSDVEIDRIEIFDTNIPILTTTVYGSYSGLPEQVDAITGNVVFSSENFQPVNGAVVMYDTFYALKGDLNGTSLYSLQASGNLEPAQWQEPEVAQKSGSIGTLAYDFGEQWIVMANRNGIYLFDGGQPHKITQEIYQVWDSINWDAGQTIWIKNDVVHRRLFVGVPMPTPNFWLPNAPMNANPLSPNVILTLNYQGLDSGSEVQTGMQMHTTMFGTLASLDMRRKWTIWQIPSPYGAVVEAFNSVTGELDDFVYFCNGKGNSKVYRLDSTAPDDDGTVIDSLYTTAGLVQLATRAQNPVLGYGRTRIGYMVAFLESLGLINVRFYPNRLLGPGIPPAGYLTWDVPGGFTPGNPAMNDVEASLNFAATRTFVEFRENDGQGFKLNNLALHIKKDIWNAQRGAK